MNHLLSFLFLLVSIVGSAQKTANPASELKQQQKDFAIFKSGLSLIESKMDRHISMDSIQSFLSATENTFNSEVLSPIEEFKLYARCIDLIESGHTQAVPNKKVLVEYFRKAKSLPFDLIMVNKHLYVNGYATQSKNARVKRNKSEELAKGAEIIAIDGKSIAEWMLLIGEFIGSDEDDPSFEYTVAGQLFDFYRFLATETHTDRLEVDVVFKKDTTRESILLTYPPLKLADTRFKAIEKQHEKDRRTPGKFKFIGNDVGYFRFTTFDEAIGNQYSEFLKKSFKKIKKKKQVKTVVIDLRGNGGGNVQTELMSYFLEKPQEVGSYKIVKRLKKSERKHIKKNDHYYRLYKKNLRRFKRFEKKHPGYDGQLISYPVDTSLIYRGNVIVLTDEGTFSAASLLASQLKTLRDAQIMGSRAGGSFHVCNAGTLTYVLPNSGIKFVLNPNACASTLDLKSIDPAVKEVDVEIVPDYDPKAGTYKKNWEGVVKTALKYAKK